MKNGWKIVPLEALVTQEKGSIKIGPFGSQLKKCDLATSGVHVVGIENVLSGKFDGLGERFISSEKFQDLKSVEILPGDLLITMMGTIGKVAIVPDRTQKSIMDSHLLRIRPDRKLCCAQYLAWAIQGSPAVQQAMEDKAHGSIMQGLNSAIVRSLPIFLPPLPEQQRIVNILDKTFEGITTTKANAEKNLQNARALFESHLQAVFTQRGEECVEKPLAQLCDPKRIITYGVIKLGDEVPGGVPCLRTSNVRWLHIETQGIKRISPALSSEYSRTILKGGEVLVNVRGTLGGVAVAAKDMAGWNVSREVAVVPIDPSRINPVFLTYFIGAGASQQWLGDVKKGAAYVGINLEDLRLLPVCAPGLEKQLEVIHHLKSIEQETQRLEAIYQQKLSAFEELKKSLLHQAFSGQL